MKESTKVSRFLGILASSGSPLAAVEAGIDLMKAKLSSKLITAIKMEVMQYGIERQIAMVVFLLTCYEQGLAIFANLKQMDLSLMRCYSCMIAELNRSFDIPRVYINY